jgi:hypothetical protein
MNVTANDPAQSASQEPDAVTVSDPAVLDDQQFPSRRYGWWTLLGLALVTIVLRLAFLPASGTSRALDPSGDSIAYVDLAEGLRHGCGFARLHDGKCTGAEIDRTPGYPIFLASFPNLRAALIVQVLLAGLVVFATGGFVYLNWGLGAAVMAAAFMALDLPSIVYAAELMTETLFTACFLLATLIALYALNDHSRAQRLRVPLLFAASALLSFGLLTRPIGEFSLAVPAIMVILVSSDSWSRRLALQVLLIALPLLTIVGWSIRNRAVSGVAAPSSVGASNLFYYRAGGTMAFSSGSGWFGAIRRLGSRPQAELTADAFRIIVHHPLAFTEMTAWSLLFVALAPVRTPLNHLLGVQRYFPVQDPGSIRLRAALHTLATSPRTTLIAIYHNEFAASPTIVLLTGLQFLSVILLWLGVIAGLRFASTRSYRGACVVVLAASALLLMLLAAGPEGTARLRIPALPFLSMIAGIGWTRRLGASLSMLWRWPNLRPAPQRASPA